MARKTTPREKRKARIRRKLSGTADRPRLTVYKSLKHMYAQLVDDTTGKTLLSVGTTSKALKTSGKHVSAAEQVGQLVSERLKAKGIEKVVFDRSGYVYHGRIKAVADGARKGGLQF